MTAAEHTNTNAHALKNDVMDDRIAAIVARHNTAYDKQTVRCGLCPWTFTGSNADAQQHALEHRERHKPEWETSRRRRRKAPQKGGQSSLS